MRSNRFGLRLAVASGLVLGGVAVLVAALFRPHGDGWDLPSGLVALTAVLAALVGSWALMRRWREVGWAERVAAVASLVAVAAIGAIGGRSVSDQFGNGFPGLRAVTIVVGCIAAVAGLASMFGAPLPVRPTRSRAAVLAAIVAVTGAAVWFMPRPVADAVDRLALDSSTADTAETPGIPAEVSAVAWSVEMPSHVDRVVAGGTGVVALVDDGVIAIDGATGEERWHYRRPGATAEAIGASPDGRSVVFTFRGGADDRRLTLVGLDALTGEERFVEPLNERPVQHGTLIVTNNAVATSAGFGSSSVVALSVDTGDELWSAAPQSFGPCLDSGPHGAATDAFLLRCLDVDSEKGSVAVVDDRTGGHSTIPGNPTERHAGLLAVSLDGAAVLVRSVEDGHVDFQVVDVDTRATQRVDEPIDLGFLELVEAGVSRFAVISRDGSVVIDRETGSTIELDQPPVVSGGLPDGAVAVLDEALLHLGHPDGGSDAWTSGEVVVVAQSEEGSTNELAVDLGGPYIARDGPEPVASFVAAPGAVVVVANNALDAGGTQTLVGLR